MDARLAFLRRALERSRAHANGCRAALERFDRQAGDADAPPRQAARQRLAEALHRAEQAARRAEIDLADATSPAEVT